MKKVQNWRLPKLPTPEQIRELVGDKIITTEEARQMLFKEENEEDRDMKALEQEIKFLKELVEKLAQRETIIKTIETIKYPYAQQQWVQPYVHWCTNTPTITVGSSTMDLNSAYQAAAGSCYNRIEIPFSSI
jgi:uncharacterized membrane-anchored protein YjiN (DUF445 family)